MTNILKIVKMFRVFSSAADFCYRNLIRAQNYHKKVEDLDSLSTKSNEMRKQHENLKNFNETIINELDLMNKTLEAQIKEKKEAENKRQATKEQLNLAQNNKKEAEEERNKQKQLLEEIKNEKTEKESQISQITTKNQEITELINNSESQLKTLIDSINDTNSKLTKQQNLLQTQSNQLAKDKECIEQKDKDILVIEKEFNESNENLKQQEKELNQMNEDLSTNLTKYNVIKKESTNLSNEVEELSRKLISLKAIGQNYNSELSNITKEQAVLVDDKNSSERKKNDLDEIVCKIAAEISNNDKTIESMKQKIKQYSINHMNAQIADKEESLTEYDEKIAKAKKEIEKIQHEIQVLESDLF